MNRREWMWKSAGLGLLAAGRLRAQDAKPGAFAEELTKTPKQTEGPFYPVKLPLDTDNDLLITNDSITPALGEISPEPSSVPAAQVAAIGNVEVEISHLDHSVSYMQAQTTTSESRDSN